MDPQETQSRLAVRLTRAGGLFILALLASHLLPYLALVTQGRFLGNFLFFFPQVAYPYDTLTRDVPHAQVAQPYLFGETEAILLELLQWGLITVAFAWLTRNLRPAFLFPLALAVIIAVTFTAQWGFRLAGLTISLDGP